MKLVLTDNTEINCTLNGNNYITTDDISNVDFTDKNFKSIKIENDEGNITTLENTHCCNVFEDIDGMHIIFRLLTSDEIKRAEQDATINDLLAYVLGGK